MHEVTPAAHIRKRGNRAREQGRQYSTQGAVIAVPVRDIASDEVGWRPLENQIAQLRQDGCGLQLAEAAKPLIRPAQKASGLRRNAKDLQGGYRLSATKLGPALPIGGIQPLATGKAALRPGIVFAIGEINNRDGRASLDRVLQQDAGAEGFVIRMRRKEKQPGARVKQRQGHDTKNDG